MIVSVWAWASWQPIVSDWDCLSWPVPRRDSTSEMDRRDETCRAIRLRKPTARVRLRLDKPLPAPPPPSVFPQIDESLGFQIPHCYLQLRDHRNFPRNHPSIHPSRRCGCDPPMAGKPGSLKRFVVTLLPLAKEEEWDAGEKMALMPCTAAHGNKPGAAASAESPLEQQQCATEKAMAEGERRSSKRKARRASKGSKPAGTLVSPDGEEMILVPRGKLALSKKLVNKILSLERRELPHVADLLDDDNPNPSEAEKALRKSVRYMDRYNKKRQDKLEECQAMILKLRHAKGYAVVDNHLEMRVAVCKAEGIFLEEDDIPDLIDEGLYLAYN